MAPTVDIQSISSTLTDSVRFSPVAVLEAKLTTSSREDDVGEMWINIGLIYYPGNLRIASPRRDSVVGWGLGKRLTGETEKDPW